MITTTTYSAMITKGKKIVALDCLVTGGRGWELEGRLLSFFILVQFYEKIIVLQILIVIASFLNYKYSIWIILNSYRKNALPTVRPINLWNKRTAFDKAI